MHKRGFTPLEINNNSNIDYGNASGRISEKKRFLSLTGFTFLEILFMVVVVSVGLLAIMNWVPVAIQTKIKTERRTTAIFLAQEKIEEIKRRALANFNDDFDQYDPLNWSVPYNNFQWTASDNLEGSDIKIVSVSTWYIEEPDNKITFDTKIARR